MRAIQADQHVGLPTVPHARAHGGKIGRSQHEQHVEHFGRADVDREPQDQFLVVRIAAKRQVRHHQVFVHQELERLGLAQGQVQALGRFFGDPQANFAVILDKTFAQVVDQQRQVQDAFLLDAKINAAQRSRIAR